VGGAIEAAGTIGTSAVKTVREMLVGVVEGVKEVASAALPKGTGRTSTPEKKTSAAGVTTKRIQHKGQ
jgi:hypothetical protein